MEPLEQLEEIAGRCLERMQIEGDSALDEVCRRHPEHAERLRDLVRRLGRIGLLEDPGESDTQRFSEFRILDRLGGGGMGVVYLAEQERLKRRVALKVMRPGFCADPKARERFRREVEALSRVDHPGICTIHEAGECDGRPFLAMRLIEGESLAAVLDRRRAAGVDRSSTSTQGDLRRDLEMIEQLARAVHAAHEAGLVHRDLKPANVMIDREGNPVVLDFGLVQADDDALEHLTRSGDLLGTPAYMAPEQVSGGRAVDRRADVHALGVILYECLTLRLPFDARSRDALYHQILAESPPDPRRYNRRIGRELTTVIGATLEKRPERRLATALELAEEVLRIRTNVPIVTRPPWLGTRVVRWAQRNRVASGVLGTALAGLLLALVLLYLQQQAWRRQRAFAFGRLADEVHREDGTLAFKFRRESLRVDDSPSPLVLADVQEAAHSLVWERRLTKGTVRGLLHRAVWSPDGRYLALLASGANAESTLFTRDCESLCSMPGSDAVAFRADSRQIAIGDREGRVHIAALAGGPPDWRVTPAPPGSGPGAVADLGYDPTAEDRLLVAFARGRAALLESGGHIRMLEHAQATWAWRASAFLPDGTIVARGGLWSREGNYLRSLAPASRETKETIVWVKVSAGRFLTLSATGCLRIYDHAGEARGPGRSDFGSDTFADFSPDGDRILVTTRGGPVFLLDKGGRELWRATTESGMTVMHGCFSRDGRGILVGDWGGVVERWTLDGIRTGWQVGQHCGIKWIAESVDSRLAVTSFSDARLWDPGRDIGVPVHRDLGWTQVVALPPGNRRRIRVAVGSDRGRLLLLDAAGVIVAEKPARPGKRFVQRALDGERVLFCGEEGDVLEWDIETDEVLERTFGQGFLRAPAALAGGRLAIVDRDRGGHLWDPARGGETMDLGPAIAVAASRDGSSFVLGRADGRLSFFSASGSAAGELSLPSAILSVALGPRAERVVAGGVNGEMYLVDRASPEHRRVFIGHRGGVVDAVFSPAGDRIATASDDQTVILWDLASGEPRLALRGHRRGVRRVSFLDEEWIASGAADGTARLWALSARALRQMVGGIAVSELTDDEFGRHEALIR